MEKDEKVINFEQEGIGSVQIADEVVAVIVAIAATEVEGVATMGDDITSEIMSKVGIKNLAQGVKLAIEDGKVSVEVKLTVEYGYNIPATCAKVQEKVKNTVENMTGLTVTDVDVRITGVGVKKA